MSKQDLLILVSIMKFSVFCTVQNFFLLCKKSHLLWKSGDAFKLLFVSLLICAFSLWVSVAKLAFRDEFTLWGLFSEIKPPIKITFTQKPT